MQYLTYIINENKHVILDFSPKQWSGSYFTDILLWDGTFTEDTSGAKTIEQWLANVSNSVVLLAAESITPKLIRQHPEFLI